MCSSHLSVGHFILMFIKELKGCLELECGCYRPLSGPKYDVVGGTVSFAWCPTIKVAPDSSEGSLAVTECLLCSLRPGHPRWINNLLLALVKPPSPWPFIGLHGLFEHFVLNGKVLYLSQSNGIHSWPLSPWSDSNEESTLWKLLRCEQQEHLLQAESSVWQTWRHYLELKWHWASTVALWSHVSLNKPRPPIWHRE